MYRKRGGKGSFWEALFGERKKKQREKAMEEAAEKWQNWPMLRYVPTYSSKDPTEEAEKKEKQEEDSRRSRTKK